MIDDKVAFFQLLEKFSDASFMREMIGFAADVGDVGLPMIRTRNRFRNLLTSFSRRDNGSIGKDIGATARRAKMGN